MSQDLSIQSNHPPAYQPPVANRLPNTIERRVTCAALLAIAIIVCAAIPTAIITAAPLAVTAIAILAITYIAVAAYIILHSKPASKTKKCTYHNDAQPAPIKQHPATHQNELYNQATQLTEELKMGKITPAALLSRIDGKTRIAIQEADPTIHDRAYLNITAYVKKSESLDPSSMIELAMIFGPNTYVAKEIREAYDQGLDKVDTQLVIQIYTNWVETIKRRL